jgi:hypothetical protein
MLRRLLGRSQSFCKGGSESPGSGAQCCDMRATPLLAFLTVAAAAVFSAVFAPSTNGAIRLHASIGPIKLGMSGAQVKRALGKPDAIVRRRYKGRRLVKYDYMLSKSWAVTFVQRKSRLTVVEVTTNHRAQRTRARAGVGTSEARLRRAHRGVRCRNVPVEPGGAPVERECVLSRPGRQTVFIIGVGPNPHEVLLVMVRNTRVVGVKRLR